MYSTLDSFEREAGPPAQRFRNHGSFARRNVAKLSGSFGRCCTLSTSAAQRSETATVDLRGVISVQPVD